ncbi:MAG TPA: RNA polymerase sigma factor [Candidatus Acidoferrales bacterium]|jgi:RNA polymerase sigma-70 factor (ECF subfamily)|nr:RNA polymerase sigma factor [Candidatus Acidoferrales bacterium]
MHQEAIVVATYPRDDAEHAFERAVLPERPRLYALAVTITRDLAEAEDAVQDTMLSAWRSWAKVRDPNRPGPWLTRICVNHCLQRQRRINRLLRSGDTREVLLRPPIEFEGELLDFDRAFAQLSVRQRAVFALHVHHGYTLNECARLLGCRPGTARSHLGRAVAALRREMINA